MVSPITNTSRIVLQIVLFLFISSFAFAQKKADFVASAKEGWLVSVEEAFELSSKSNRPILANFTGSDWCGWCKKLDAEVFSKAEFKEWASKNVILLELDYPRFIKLPEKQVAQNQELQNVFQVSGFPTIWVFDLKRPEGSQFQIVAYGRTGYLRGGESAFIEEVNKMLEQRKQSNNN